MNFIKHINYKKIIIGIIVVSFIEIFICNHSYWLSRHYEPISVSEIYTETGEPLQYGVDYPLTEDSYLEIKDINSSVKNIYLNIDSSKWPERNVLSINLNMIDEGNSSYYCGDTRYIASELSKCNYISLYTYGNLKSLKITFPSESGINIQVNEITLNKTVPFHISIRQVAIICFLYICINILFFSPYTTYYQADSKKHKLISACLLVFCVTLLITLMLVSKSNPDFYSLDQYTELTHALASGNVSVDIDIDERLLSAENPYDPDERRDLGLSDFGWDYSYYNNKLYVYFGVTPVILMYLPYYLITGKDLPHMIPYTILLLGLAIGAFMLIDVLVKKYCKKIPLKLYYLFQITFMLGIGTIIFAKRIAIYEMAIMSGLDFTVWGLYLWLSYSHQAETKSGSNFRLFLGSLCMALVAGCRPQLLLASFLAIPLFFEQGKQIFKDIYQKKNLSKNICTLTAFGIPYVVVAIFLMCYNAARFGSPFDFGALYSLTTNDMTRRGYNIARLIPGLWNYLFQLPSINIEFPFIRVIPLNTEYQGITTQDPVVGGLFATNIILLPCFLLYHCRKWLKKKRVFSFTVICLICALLVVCVDTEIGGIMMRYVADFSIFLYLAAFMIIFTFIEKYYNEKALYVHLSEAHLCKAIALMCFATILFWTVSVFTMYDTHDLDLYQTVWYYHMKELLGIFDL